MANKTGTVIVLDAAPLLSPSSSSMAALRTATEWCVEFLTQKQLFNPYDEVGLIVCRPFTTTTSTASTAAVAAEETKTTTGKKKTKAAPSSSSSSSGSGVVEDVSVLFDLHVPQKDALESVTALRIAVEAAAAAATAAATTSPSPSSSSILLGIEKAAQQFTSTRKNYVVKQIVVLLSDPSTSVGMKPLVLSLLGLLPKHSISLRVVLGVEATEQQDDEDESPPAPVIVKAEQTEGGSEKSRAPKGSGNELQGVFQHLCQALNEEARKLQNSGEAPPCSSSNSSGLISWPQAMHAVKGLRIRKGMVRSLCKIVWSLGPSCRLATQLYTLSSIQTLPTLQKLVPRLPTNGSDGLHAAAAEEEENDGDEGRTEGGGKASRKRARSDSASGEAQWDEVVRKQLYFPLLSAAATGEEEDATSGDPAAVTAAPKPIPPEELLTAYRYGSSWIPCTEADVYAMKLHEGERSLQTLAFVKEEEVAAYIGLGGAKAMVPLAGDVHAQRGFNALVMSMMRLKRCAVVRYVRVHGAAPRLGLLSVPTLMAEDEDVDEEEEVSGDRGEALPPGVPHYLVLSLLPFQDDVRLFQLDGEPTPSSHGTAQQRAAVEQLVSSMTLEDDDPCCPSEWVEAPCRLHNPTYQHFYSVLRSKLQVAAMKNLDTTGEASPAEKWGGLATKLLPSPPSPSLQEAVTRLESTAAAAVEAGHQVLDARVATTSSGFHYRPFQHHVLFHFYDQQVTPSLERLCACFPGISLTLEEEEAKAAAQLASRRRHVGEGGGAGWFSAAAALEVEKATTTADAVLEDRGASDSRRRNGGEAPDASSSAPSLSGVMATNEISTINPAESFQTSWQSILCQAPTVIEEGGGSHTQHYEGQLYHLLGELESVLHALLINSFPDTQYTRVRDAVAALRQFATTAHQIPATGSVVSSPSVLRFDAYYNDFLKKLLLWCRAQQHEEWFVSSGILVREAAHQAKGVTDTLLDACEALHSPLLPITQAEVGSSNDELMKTSRDGLRWLLATEEVATELPGEDPTQQEEDLLDDWID